MTFYDRSGTSPDQVKPFPTTSTTSVHEIGKFTRRLSNFLPTFHGSRQRSISTLVQASPATTKSKSKTEHPQDHTRLKTVWEAMLATRFLSPSILSVIPFYLTSSSFVNTKILSPLAIPLPANSGTLPSLSSCRSFKFLRGKEPEKISADTLLDFTPSISTRSTKADGFSVRFPIPSTYRPPVPALGTMHLAKTVRTVQGCKEAMFVEYKKLYSNEPLSLLSRTAPEEEDYRLHPHEYLVRKAFEVDWRNWELCVFLF